VICGILHNYLKDQEYNKSTMTVLYHTLVSACEQCFSDAILSRDSDNVQDRVLSLEKKIQQQDDEIVCLKSALADALRRLTALESGKPVSRIDWLTADEIMLCCAVYE